MTMVKPISCLGPLLLFEGGLETLEESKPLPERLVFVMCEHIEYSQRLILVNQFVKSKAGVWISIDEIIAYLEKLTGVRETPNYITGPMAAVARSCNHVVIRGSKLRYETEAMRTERVRVEEEDKELRLQERKNHALSAFKKVEAKVQTLQKELEEAAQAQASLRVKLTELYGSTFLS